MPNRPNVNVKHVQAHVHCANAVLPIHTLTHSRQVYVIYITYTTKFILIKRVSVLKWRLWERDIVTGRIRSHCKWSWYAYKMRRMKMVTPAADLLVTGIAFLYDWLRTTSGFLGFRLHNDAGSSFCHNRQLGRWFLYAYKIRSMKMVTPAADLLVTGIAFLYDWLRTTSGFLGFRLDNDAGSSFCHDTLGRWFWYGSNRHSNTEPAHHFGDTAYQLMRELCLPFQI